MAKVYRVIREKSRALDSPQNRPRNGWAKGKFYWLGLWRWRRRDTFNSCRETTRGHLQRTRSPKTGHIRWRRWLCTSTTAFRKFTDSKVHMANTRRDQLRRLKPCIHFCQTIQKKVSYATPSSFLSCRDETSSLDRWLRGKSQGRRCVEFFHEHNQCSDHHEVAGDLNLLSDYHCHSHTSLLNMFVTWDANDYSTDYQSRKDAISNKPWAGLTVKGHCFHRRG